MNSDTQQSIIRADEVVSPRFQIGMQDTLPGPAVKAQSTLQEIFRVLAKRKGYVIASILVAVGAAIWISMMMKPRYGATAIIEVNKSDSGSSGLDLASELSASLDGGGDDLLTTLQTETAVLRSDTIAADVIDRMKLDQQEPYASVEKKIKAKQGGKISQDAALRSALVWMLKSQIQVEPLRGTRLIQISVEDYDPNRAAKIANTVVESYKAEYLRSHYAATSEASDWLTKQLEDLKKNVEDSETRLTEFEKSSGILNFDLAPASHDSTGGGGGGAHSVVIQKLDELNTQLTQAEAARIEKEAIYRFTKSGNADAIMAIGNDPMAANSGSAVLTESGGLATLGSLRQQQGALKIALAQASAKYDINNRHLKDLQLQAQELDRQVADEINRIAARAQADYQVAKQTEDTLRSRLQAQQEEANKLNGKAVQLAVLSQEAFSRKKLYEDLYTKLQEANVSAGIKATNITVVDPAWPQPSPVRPRPSRNAMFGLFFGLLFGVVLAFAVDNFDRTLSTPSDLEEITGIPVMGTIPQLGSEVLPKSLALRKGGAAAPIRGRDTLWVLTRPKSAIAESCRSLRTSIMLSRPGAGPKVLLVTSSVPGEGKTTLSANLACVFAQHNKKVLILEADLRRPRMATIFGVGNEVGLSNVLTGGATADSAIVRGVELPGLDLLPAGPVPPLPSEILDSQAFDQLLSDLRERYDLIVIDSPPATIVTDPIPLAIKSDGVVWISRSGTATRPLVTRSAEIVRKYRLPLIGFVMNGINLRSVDYRYTYYGHNGESGYYDDSRA